jgi:dihydroflavonol-4-reductase
MPVVFAADVGEGHVLAAEKAESGSRYILSDRYFTLTEVAAEVVRQLGLRRVPPVMPLWIGKLVAAAGESISRRTGRPPLIPKGQLHFLQWEARPQADRAKRELGWTPTPFTEGLARTLEATG